MGFLINSGIHRYILKQPDLLACQVKIKASDYKCLNHNSYIDCIDLYAFDDAELTDERDTINIMTKAEIRKAVGNAKTLEARFQKLILRNC